MLHGKLPRRLSILLEGESLLNDATGLVLFRVRGRGGGHRGVQRGARHSQSFLVLAIGGASVGALVGAAWVALVRRLGDDYLIIASSILSGWASFLLGDTLHVSGVIATVATGLVCGWYQHVLFPAAVRMRGASFWTVLIFLLEAMVFMLIGLSLRDVLTRVGGIGVVLDGWPCRSSSSWSRSRLPGSRGSSDRTRCRSSCARSA